MLRYQQRPIKEPTTVHAEKVTYWIRKSDPQPALRRTGFYSSNKISANASDYSIAIPALRSPQSLNQVSDIHGHLLNGRVVERLNVSKDPLVFLSNKVNGNAFSAKPTSTANPGKETGVSKLAYDSWLTGTPDHQFGLTYGCSFPGLSEGHSWWLVTPAAHQCHVPEETKCHFTILQKQSIKQPEREKTLAYLVSCIWLL